MSVLSPLMRQYVAIKEQYRDTLLLFQVGDFYELFFEDAQTAAQFLGITLTKRGMIGDEPIPLCGVPVHMVDHYLQKLVRGGFKVALCTQQSEPVPGKIVERAVTQVITPGTLVDTPLMQEAHVHYLVALEDVHETRALIACELLSGKLIATTLEKSDHRLLEDEITRLSPKEIVLRDNFKDASLVHWCKSRGYIVSLLEQSLWSEYFASASEIVEKEYSSHVLVATSPAVQSALSLLIAYVKRSQAPAITYLQPLVWYSPQEYMQLDEVTQRNLEIVESMHRSMQSNTLFDVLHESSTSMGARCIKNWLLRPLLSQELIEQRHKWVGLFKDNARICFFIRSILKEIGDFERICGRIALNKAGIQDYKNLAHALQSLPQIQQMVARLHNDDYLLLTQEVLERCNFIAQQLKDALNTDESKDWRIRSGFHPELDRLRELVHHGNDAILALERDEQTRTGITTLKIRDHQSHGYGFEITKANLHLVPVEYVRVQSLVNRDRFTSAALKELEYALRQSHIQVAELEKELFTQLATTIVENMPVLRMVTEWLTKLDALTTFGYCAYQRGYVRPKIVDERIISIQHGKHPVVAEILKHEYKPNTVELNDNQRLLVITGPNMGGKSTYLRQVALLVIMCQAGSFIPAESAQLMIVDRIFTRIGASDNVARGESTFYVEMKEAATICSLATAQSLVILDEIGRGTSTYDGLSLAQAILEYMYEDRQSRCLFATHYHELSELSQKFSAIKNYHAASLSQDDKVILLHEIRPGVAEGSFGIAVAQMAHMPHKVIERARLLKKYYESR